MSVGLTTRAAFVQSLASAGSIEFAAYSLRRGGAVARALECAGERGATVEVELEGCPYAKGGARALARANRRMAAELRAHGVRARLAGPADERLHLKGAVVDGTAYLSDRNWPDRGGDTIVRTNARADVIAVRAALHGSPSSSAGLATEKGAALRSEAAAIARGTGDRVDIETESFGSCSVSKALRARAAAGGHVRLMVSGQTYERATPRERSALANLAAEGVEVRLGGSNEKLCVAGKRGWVGSANASYSPAPMLDWGLQTRDRAVLAGLSAAFRRDWARAEPLT